MWVVLFSYFKNIFFVATLHFLPAPFLQLARYIFTVLPSRLHLILAVTTSTSTSSSFWLYGCHPHFYAYTQTLFSKYPGIFQSLLHLTPTHLLLQVFLPGRGGHVYGGRLASGRRPALPPSAECPLLGEHSQTLHLWSGIGSGIPPLQAHHTQVRGFLKMYKSFSGSYFSTIIIPVFLLPHCFSSCYSTFLPYVSIVFHLSLSNKCFSVTLSLPVHLHIIF